MTRFSTMLLTTISIVGLSACDRTEKSYMVRTLERDRHPPGADYRANMDVSSVSRMQLPDTLTMFVLEL